MKRSIYSISVILFIMALIFACTKIIHTTNNAIHFSQRANSSSGSYWNYSLSADTVICEKEYFETRSPLNFGPGYTQNWVFDLIGEGDVTIHWAAYRGGFLSEKDSFDITYHFDKNGKYTVISESQI